MIYRIHTIHHPMDAAVYMIQTFSGLLEYDSTPNGFAPAAIKGEVYLKFDMDIFMRQAVPIMVEEGYTRNEMQKIRSFIQLFVDSYKAKTGEDHPPLKTIQVERIVRSIESVRDYYDREIPLELDDYPDLIAQYFAHDFKGQCNYRLNHFFSGRVREILFYRILCLCSDSIAE